MTPPPANPLGSPKPEPLRIGGNVRPPRLIHDVKPVYPHLAVISRISGTVRIEAILTREGAVQSLRVVSGHPLLVKAAVDAVRQWRYKPTLLNGVPTEVALAIDVNFTLNR
jgi:protein TonB